MHWMWLLQKRWFNVRTAVAVLFWKHFTECDYPFKNELPVKMILNHSHMWIFVCSYTGNDAFTIRHDKENKCIQVKNSLIVIDDCRDTSEALWKWVSQNRLFHLGSKQCLGLDIFTKSLSRLKMVDCNSELMLWWRCADASIVGASQYKVTIKNNYVTASINATDQWKSNNSSSDICRYPYHGK